MHCPAAQPDDAVSMVASDRSVAGGELTMDAPGAEVAVPPWRIWPYPMSVVADVAARAVAGETRSAR